MNKSAVLSLIGCLSALPAVATDSRQEMLDMLVSQLHTSPELTKDASCLGVSAEVLKDAFEKHLYLCAETPAASAAADVETFMNVLESCYVPAVRRELDISKSEFDACNEASGESSEDELNAKLDTVMKSIGPNGPTPQQRQQLQALRERQMQRGQDDIQRALGGMLSFARATQDQITLPIYKNSEILVHMTESEEDDRYKQVGSETVEVLPAATFASPDSPEKILAFYKNELPGFEVKQLANNEFILMEIMPPDFDLLSDVQVYTSTPHVLIKKATQGAEGVVPADTQSMIEIAYRR